MNHAGARVAALFTATATLAAPFATGTRPSIAGVAVVMLGFAACLAVCVRATMYRLDRLWGATVIACLAGATSVASLVALAGGLRPGPAGFMINWATAGTAGGLAFTRGFRWGSVAVLAGLGPALAIAWSGGLAYPHDVLVGPLTYLIGASVMRAAALRGFAATERALAAAEAATTAVRVAEERWDAAREDQRRLHDTVLATLTLLAHRGRGVAPEAVLRACERDIELLRSGRLDVTLLVPSSTSTTPRDAPTPAAGVPAQQAVRPDAGEPADGPRGRHHDDAGLGTGLDAGFDAGLDPGLDAALDLGLDAVVLARSTQAGLDGLDVRVHLPDRAVPRLTLPAAEAIGAALGECLANVRRHAGVGAADVTVVLEDDVASVIVVDEGIGFDPGAVPEDRMGLRCSVQERLRAVGGQATVWSGTGRGTSVLLTVPVTGPLTGSSQGPIGVMLTESRTDTAGSR